MLASKWSAFKTLVLTSSIDTMSLNCDPNIKSTCEAWLQTQDALASTCTDRGRKIISKSHFQLQKKSLRLPGLSSEN